MEKKTIGKFISALRRANGMTQKELGEKLFVSDKTVSRWECDECTPELSLIPSIAEIFGITTDELLRGERNNPDREAVSEDAASKQKAKSDKQFKLMLDRNNRKYKNLTLISVGITILGLIVAIIANVGFSKGLIAFCLATAFCVASEICQICFAINARITPDEDDDTYTDKIEVANTGVIKTATTITFVNLLLFAFCLPLVTMINGANYGLVFEYWLGYGLLWSAIAFVVCYILYALIIHKTLCKKGLIVLTEKRTDEIKHNNKLLVKTVSISIAVALILGAGVVVWNTVGWDVTMKEKTFDSWADFKAFMEDDYDKWVESGYSYIDLDGNLVIQTQIGNDVEEIYPDGEKTSPDKAYPKKEITQIRNSKGEVICEYYYNPDLYKRIIFTESSVDRMPVTVLTNQAYYDGRDIFQAVESTLYTLIVVDFVVATGIYLIKTKKGRKTV
ncbi:MAG: helix-turn-helix domain-containing protein [Ruminococcaceae bacterium]|nr:helix-turn-helix domain-containing protein [Oscillospiraceae bacterium]